MSVSSGAMSIGRERVARGAAEAVRLAPAPLSEITHPYPPIPVLLEFARLLPGNGSFVALQQAVHHVHSPVDGRSGHLFGVLCNGVRRRA